jgi:hypothetical protein
MNATRLNSTELRKATGGHDIGPVEHAAAQKAMQIRGDIDFEPGKKNAKNWTMTEEGAEQWAWLRLGGDATDAGSGCVGCVNGGRNPRVRGGCVMLGMEKRAAPEGTAPRMWKLLLVLTGR